MTQSPLDLVAHDRNANGLAHDETRTRRGNAFPRCVRVRCTATTMNDKERAPGPASPAYRGRKVLAPPQPIFGRQHVMDLEVRLLRPTGGRDPCHGGTRGSRGRHGSACADGNRGSSRDGGCSAGRCACSLGGSRNACCLTRDRCGASIGCHRAPTSSSLSQRLSAPLHDHQSAIFAHRRQAAAAIDNSTWSRYARLRHPVKPAPWQRAEPAARTHYAQPVDNNLNPQARPDYRG